MDNKKNNKLATDNFHGKDLFEKDLQTKEDILFLLYDVDIGEYQLTHAGYLFLEKEHGIEKIAQWILEDIEKGVDFKWRTKEDIIKWLKEEAIEKPKQRNEWNLE